MIDGPPGTGEGWPDRGGAAAGEEDLGREALRWTALRATDLWRTALRADRPGRGFLDGRRAFLPRWVAVLRFIPMSGPPPSRGGVYISSGWIRFWKFSSSRSCSKSGSLRAWMRLVVLSSMASFRCSRAWRRSPFWARVEART